MNKPTKPIAIIPARKNSKRIKDKNIVNFFGKPLISITIKNLIDTKLFSNVYVSTDSKKIARIAEKNGAEVLFPRPKHLSNDSATLIQVISYELQHLDKIISNDQKVYCILPTAIFINKIDIINTKKKFSKNTGFIITGIKQDKSVLRNFYFHKKKMKFISSKFLNFRTQDLPETFRDAGQLYLASKKTWLKKKSVFSAKTTMIQLDKEKYIDIDNLDDLYKARKIYAHVKKK